ncbi:MAG: MgtC/SapB family protein [Lawsonibacter sp.]|jgi:putative Mg2+ transporter-C (MgtC) family protein|uniref:MgtC/SapB family protein n=1 Tax=Lawsonibacter sp. JLR.KK007 TaxID=3114293 RepID=UPI002172607F|nr:MgtC/SapB family protein [Lawsonibacter sp.]MCI8989499.1 MgtC/SapB family protein [Lawsonibacter sp.]MCI9267737.1 MgtC/SapB family protein [Lawsonibacter sp.]
MLDALREFNMPSVLLRLTLAVLCGGMIGVNREHKRRPAGFRTYMLVCLGSAMTGVLSQYLWVMMNTQWAEVSALLEKKIDVSRIGAKAIGGVGFLGAGTILITDQSEVKGLTTAAGLWASACLGVAIGAGFYEGALAGFAAIFLSIKVLPRIEEFLLSRSRNMNLYVELVSPERLRDFIALLKAMGIQIFDVELERKGQSGGGVSVVLYLHLPKSQSHTKLLANLSYSPDVRAIDEI